MATFSNFCEFWSIVVPSATFVPSFKFLGLTVGSQSREWQILWPTSGAYIFLIMLSGWLGCNFWTGYVQPNGGGTYTVLNQLTPHLAHLRNISGYSLLFPVFSYSLDICQLGIVCELSVTILTTGGLSFFLKTNWQNRHDPGSGSGNPGAQKNWAH